MDRQQAASALAVVVPNGRAPLFLLVHPAAAGWWWGRRRRLRGRWWSPTTGLGAIASLLFICHLRLTFLYAPSVTDTRNFLPLPRGSNATSLSPA